MVNEKTVPMTSEHKRVADGFLPSAFLRIKNKCKKLYIAITTAIVMQTATAISAFAASAPSTTSGGTDQGEEMFNNLIIFFAKWIGRIGLVVGFIGAVMFGLAVRQEDSEGKTRGLLTMASGFIVFAVTLSLNLFGITT
ncbi:MAG: hypothetical protein ACI4JS_07970 [Oscillospiraceae bacterium]